MRRVKANRSIGPVTLMIILLTGTAACSSSGIKASQSANGTKGEFVIGAVAGLTGSFANVDISETNALKVGIDQVNAAGGILGKKVRLELRDDGSEPNREILAIQDLVDNVKPDLLMPDPISALALAALPFTTSKKILTMAGSSGAALGDPTKYPYNFTFGDLSSKRVPAVAQLVLRGGQTKVDLLYATSAAQKAFGEGFLKVAPTMGLTIVKSMTIESTTDITPQLATLKAAGANVIVFDDEKNGAVHVLMTGLQGMGWKVPVYVSPEVLNGDMSQQVPAAVKDQFHGVNLGIGILVDKPRPALDAWVNAMAKKGKLDFRLSASQTDLVWVAKWAYETAQAKSGNVSADSVRKVLESISTANFPYADKMVLWPPNPGFTAEFHNPSGYDTTNFWGLSGAAAPVNGGYPGELFSLKP